MSFQMLAYPLTFLLAAGILVFGPAAGGAVAAPIGQNCDSELVRCSPVAVPQTTAGTFQGGIGWQAAGPQGVRGWHER